MQRNFLIKRLIIPLLLLAILSLVLSYFLPWQGLFINLFTTFLGILITVFYVDKILSEHDRQRWAGVTSRVNKRIEVISNLTISEIGSIFYPRQQLYDTS